MFAGEPFYLVLLPHRQEGVGSNDQQPTVGGHRRFNPGKLTVQPITQQHLFIVNGKHCCVRYLMGVSSQRPGVPCAGVRDGRVSEVLRKDSGRSVWNLVGHCSSCCVTVHCEHFFCLGVGRVLCAINAAYIRHWHAGLSPHTMTLY